jgi:hypothetical protein
MPRGDLALFMIVIGLAIALSELQVAREGTTRYLCLAAVWVILIGMTIWAAYAR